MEYVKGINDWVDIEDVKDIKDVKVIENDGYIAVIDV